MKLTVEEVYAGMPSWWAPFVNWSARWANHSPRWLPFMVRRLPLWVACEGTRLRVIYLLLGDGGNGPHGDT